MHLDRLLLALLATLYCFAITPLAHAQTNELQATLSIDPFPTPYLSDWETNPNVGEATLTNTTDSNLTIKIFATLSRVGDRTIASAESRLFVLPPGSVTGVATDDLLDYGTVEYDDAIETQALRTGRLPEGEYEFCLRFEGEFGQVVLDNVCATFFIVYPEPPSLLFPFEGDNVEDKNPVFEWTPVQGPVALDINYKLTIVEILDGQVPAQALLANIVHYQQNSLIDNNLQYPITALPFEVGHSYVWQVQALDEQRLAPTSNNGNSEIWTFIFDTAGVSLLTYRDIAGTIRDANSLVPVKYAAVTYRADNGQEISIVTGRNGRYRFSGVLDNMPFAIGASAKWYPHDSLHYDKPGANSHLNLDLKMGPPGSKQLGGFVLSSATNKPVAGAVVTYQLLTPPRYSTRGRDRFKNIGGIIQRGLNPIRGMTLVDTTDANGAYLFTQTADSGYYELLTIHPDFKPRTTKPRLQNGDVKKHTILLTPNFLTFVGSFESFYGGKTHIARDVKVDLVLIAKYSFESGFSRGGAAPNPNVRKIVGSAYTDENGAFYIDRIFAPAKFLASYKVRNHFTGQTYMTMGPSLRKAEYRIVVSPQNSPRYSPFESNRIEAYHPTARLIDLGSMTLSAATGAVSVRVHTNGLAVPGAEVFIIKESLSLPPPTGDSAGGVQSVDMDAERERAWNDDGDPTPVGDTIAGPVLTGASGRVQLADIIINDPAQKSDRYVVWIKSATHYSKSKPFRISPSNSQLQDTALMSNLRVNVSVNTQPRPWRVFGSLSNGEIGAVVLLRDHIHSESGPPVVLYDGKYEMLDSKMIDPNGDYFLSGSEAGDYRLLLVAPGFARRTTDVFSLAPGEVKQVDVVLKESFGILAGKVIDKDSSGISYAHVTAEGYPKVDVITNAKGEFLIPECPAVSLKLIVDKIHHDDLVDTVIVTGGDSTFAYLKLAKSVGKLTVKVYDKSSGAALDNFSVTLDTMKATQEFGGIYKLKDLPLGPDTLIVQPKSSQGTDYGVIRKTVTVLATNQTIRIDVSPGARISGKITDKESGSPIIGASITVEGNSALKATTKTDGTYTLRNIPVGGKLVIKASKSGYQNGSLGDGWSITAGDKITNANITLIKSYIDSLYGFAVEIDTVRDGTGENKLVDGSLTGLPRTNPLKLLSAGGKLRFTNLEIDKDGKPVAKKFRLSTTEIQVSLHGSKGLLYYPGGLELEYVDTAKSGKISGNLTLEDAVSGPIPDSKTGDMDVAKGKAPALWGSPDKGKKVKFGFDPKKSQVSISMMGFILAVNYEKTYYDSTGYHFTGDLTIRGKGPFKIEDMHIGKDENGKVRLFKITVKTDPQVEFAFPGFTVIAREVSWDESGFKAAGGLKFPSLGERELGFKNLHVSKDGDFLSLTIVLDGPPDSYALKVAGQKFTPKEFDFGTLNWDDSTKANVMYFGFSGELELTQLDNPVEFESIRITEEDEISGKISFNQTKTLGKVVTILLGSIEIGNDTAHGQFVALTGGIRFGAIKGLSVQASALTFFEDGAFKVEEIMMTMTTGATYTELRVRWSDTLFEGSGKFQVRPLFNAGAEFKYGGSDNWWIKISAGAHIPLGPAVELTQVSGGLGYEYGTWKFGLGGMIAPQRADKGVFLDIWIQVNKTPAGVVIEGTGDVVAANSLALGRATLKIDIPKSRIDASLIMEYAKDAITANAQIDLHIKFGQYWAAIGRANIDAMKLAKAWGTFAIGNNYEWEFRGKPIKLDGIYLDLNSNLKFAGSVIIAHWDMEYNQSVWVFVRWNGDFGGGLAIRAHAEAGIGLGPFDLISAYASFGLGASIQRRGAEWITNANANFTLVGTIGNCSASCGSVCSRFWKPALGGKVCLGAGVSVRHSSLTGSTLSVRR